MAWRATMVQSNAARRDTDTMLLAATTCSSFSMMSGQASATSCCALTLLEAAVARTPAAVALTFSSELSSAATSGSMPPSGFRSALSVRNE